ncbi:MAG: hypothetical protein ABW199_06315 [Caulobacterales bacterium]
MAKASFHKGQRVYVKPVGTWAQVEHVVPQWVKGVEEPLRIHYDVGLGREFQAHELAAEDREPERPDLIETELWRIIRAPNKLISEPGDSRHPFPGSFPVVVTDERDWGGWRVPMSEYDRDPERIERQARVMANSLRLLRVSRELIDFARNQPHETAPQLRQLAEQAAIILQSVYRAPGAAPASAFAAE